MNRGHIFGNILSLVVALVLATSTVYAAPITVNCGKGGSINSTLANLTSTGNTRNVTISVSGTCKENVVITAFDRLTLQAAGIATTLMDASNGTLPVVEVANSSDVTVQGFTIHGGSLGVFCHHFSYCSLYTNTIRQSVDGARFHDSRGIVNGNIISNNIGAGVVVINGSDVVTGGNTISGNGAEGMRVNSGSNLTADGDTVSNNTVGIRVVKNSVLRAYDMTITGNSSDGVRLEEASTASIEQDVTGNVITGNGGHGVALYDLAFAGFGEPINVSGNLTQPDVACNPQYSATRGAGSVAGTTNCVETEQQKKSDKDSSERGIEPPLRGKYL